MIDFGVIGSGIAGATIANQLAKKFSVIVIDKARGPGGRASNRRYKHKSSFDHGLQYIAPKNKEFEKFISKLQNNKVVKLWEGNHIDFKFGQPSQKFIGQQANNQISKFLLKKIKTQFNSKVVACVYLKKFWELKLENNELIYCKHLIVTSPYDQTKVLLKKYLKKKLKVAMQPNLTVMLAVKGNEKLPISSLRFNDEIVGFAACENSKGRFKDNNTLWTIQSTEGFARKHINKFKNNKQKVINLLLKRFNQLTGINTKTAVFKNIHGWRYAYSKQSLNNPCIWSAKHRLGVCGDWFLGPKAEHAWLSATSLYKKIT